MRTASSAALRPVAFVMTFAGSFTAEWRAILPGMGLFVLAEHVRAEKVILHVDFTEEESLLYSGNEGSHLESSDGKMGK